MGWLLPTSAVQLLEGVVVRASCIPSPIPVMHLCCVWEVFGLWNFRRGGNENCRMWPKAAVFLHNPLHL